MTGRNNEPPLPEPLAYFLTWTTYGTWLPGDDRGWTDSKLGWQAPDESRVIDAKIRMQEHARTLNPDSAAGRGRADYRNMQTSPLDIIGCKLSIESRPCRRQRAIASEGCIESA